MDDYDKRLKSLDAGIEWGQFQIAAADGFWGQVWPYAKTVFLALHQKILVDRMVLARKGVVDNPEFARRVVHAAGFARPWDVVSWTESGRNVYTVWKKAKAAGDFSLLVPAASARYDMARAIGRRRIEEYNRVAADYGWAPLHKISQSFIDRQSPGLDSLKVDSMSEDLALWGEETRHRLKEDQAKTITILRAALESITPDDKMELVRRLLDNDSDGLSHVTLRSVENPLCQGYGQMVGIGLNPAQQFFVFLKAYRHERAHAAYRTHLQGSPPGAALDELLPLMDEHFILPDMEECQEVLHHLKDIMGERFPGELNAQHIKQGFASIQEEDMGGHPDFLLYAINRAIYNRTEARVLDEAIPMERFPDILAEHVLMFTGQTLSRAEAEKMALERFQPFFSLGRGKAYEAAIFAAAALAEKLKDMPPTLRRAWLREKLYTLPRTPDFMDAVKILTGENLSARGLEFSIPPPP